MNLGKDRVAHLKSRGDFTLTVRLPRSGWSEKLQAPALRAWVVINLLKGRVTCRRAVLLIRVEGSSRGIQEALHYWECCGLRVEEGDRVGMLDPVDAPGNLHQPVPSLHGRGSPPGGSHDLLYGAAHPA